MTTTAAPPIVYRKHACGFCTSGHHQLCKVATWNPSTQMPLYCPCTDEQCQGKRPVCRDCGYDAGPAQPMAPGLVCLDRTDCVLRIQQRLEDDELHQLIVQCQTTRLAGGVIVERKRRPTPVEREARRVVQAQAKSRPCTCGCEGVTKGGAFLPGHDARYVSGLVRAANSANNLKQARLALASFPALLSKFNKRVGV